MRVALAPAETIGLRAGRVLLADRRVQAIGAYGTDVQSRDQRVTTIKSPQGWDLLVSDAPFDDPRILSALRHGIPIVTPYTLSEISSSVGSSSVVAAASAQAGIPASLAELLLLRFDSIRSISAAITIESKRLRRGQPAAFPQPVGALWSERVPSPVSTPQGLSFFHSPYDGSLAAVSVRAEGEAAGSSHSVMTGVVDDPVFMGAIALAAAALMLVGSDPVDRPFEVQQRAADYIEACEEAGLGVATFSAA